MRTRYLLKTVFALCILSPQFAKAAQPTADEMADSRQWAAEHFEGTATLAAFFSFNYDGKPSAELLPTWDFGKETRRLDDQRIEYRLTWTDPRTGVVLRCVGTEYRDLPSVEWTLFFQNKGDKSAPILENILPLNTTLCRNEGGEFVLRANKGDFCAPESYQPSEHTLGPKANMSFAPVGGRPTDTALPYYNLAMPGRGMMFAVGWPGQWATRFVRDDKNGLRIEAGQQLTHLRLEPGEEIRSPLMVLLFWRGDDVVRAQNLWRKWMLAHNLPRPDGKKARPLYTFCSGGFFEGFKVSEASEKLFIDTLAKEGIRLDYWWMDAGWYPCNDWTQTGTWEPDSARFPNGIKAVSDYVHAKGTRLILWFEPERVTAGSWLATTHPEWLLGGALLNLGNVDARRWLTDHIDKMLTEQGIDLYRQDFNMAPLDFWRNNDAPDRQGMTENLHVQGYLAYWDELIRRHPGLLIDSCASGGRRNDIETLRRALPLLRSDYQSFTGDASYGVGNQGHTYGLSSWIPYYGQGVYYNPQDFVYSVRSSISPEFCIAIDVRKGNIDWDQYRRLVEQWRAIADNLLGDFYPLTPYSLNKDAWIAWQFDRPEVGEGVVQAFRRAECGTESVRVKLHSLEPNAVYLMTNLDAAGTTEMSGRELVEKGISIVMKDKPSSTVILYKKKP